LGVELVSGYKTQGFKADNTWSSVASF